MIKLEKLKKEIKALEAKEKRKVIQVTSKDTVDSKSKDIPLRLYNPLSKTSKWNIRYWKDKIKDRYFAGRVLLIDFELTNGYHRFFTVLEKDEGFIFRKKKYLFDNALKYYNLDAKMWMFKYHEDITVPVQQKIPVNIIKKTLESSGISEVEYAINPSTLQRFITAKIAEGIMQGVGLSNWMKQIRLLVIVITAVVVIHFLLFMNASGMLKNLNLPF